MSNFCMYCGAPLKEGAVFCTSCGGRVQNPADAQGRTPTTRVNKTQEFLNNKKAAGMTRPTNTAPQRGTQRQARQNVPPQMQYRQAPPSYYEPGQDYRDPYGSGRNVPRKGSAGKRVIAIVLIIAIIGGVLFAGFKYPGFFLPKDEPNMEIAVKPSGGQKTEGTDTETDTDTETQEDYTVSEIIDMPAVVSAEDVPMIRPFSEADITFTEEERNSAPVLEASVSAEEPVVTCGGVTVDFKGWNLDNDEDKLIVKELPVKTDDFTGYTVTAYDLSLASGQHEFLTDITVRIPRDPELDEGGWCVTFNEETQQWETLYSEISEDGLFYEIHTSHFSDDAKVSHTNAEIKKIAAAKKENVNNQETKDYLCNYYYPYYTIISLMKDSPVTIDFDYFWNMVNSDYTLALDDLAEWAEKTPRDSMAWQPPISFESSLGNADGVSTSFGLLGGNKAIKAGTKAIGKAAGNALRAGSKSGFLAYKLAGFGVKNAGLAIGTLNTVYNLYATPAKIYHEVQQGKSVWNATMNHKMDIIGTAAGTIGIAASLGFAVAAGPAAAALGAGAWIASMVYSAYAPRELGTVEQVYRDYYVAENDGAGLPKARILYYDTPSDGTMIFDDTGVMAALPSLKDDAEASAKLKEILKDGLLAFNPRAYGAESMFSGPTTTEARLKLQKWVLALKYLFKYAEKEPGRLMNLISEFYYSYAEAAWKVSEKDFNAFAAWDMDRRGDNGSEFKMPSEDVKKQYTDNYVIELMKAQKDILEGIIKQYEDEAKKEMEDFIRNEELMLLNTRMEFHVNGLEDTPYAVDYRTIKKNKDLMDPNMNWDGYSYSSLVLPMRFGNEIDGQYCEIQGGPLFYPYYENSFGDIQKVPNSYFWPAEAGFTPCYTEGDLVFTCTYYWYLLMGAPDIMYFTNPEEFGNLVIVPFEVPEANDGVIKINIEAPSNDLKELEGDWVRGYNGTEAENKELKEVRLGVHDGGTFNSFYSDIETQDLMDIVQRYDDDPKFFYNKEAQILTIWKKDTPLRYNYTIEWMGPNIIYLEEIDYYLEKEGIRNGTFPLRLDDESKANASLTINGDGTLTLEIPAYSYNSSDGKTSYSVTGLKLKAEKSDEPDVPWGYDEAIGKHYVVTECTDSVTVTKVTTNSKGEKKTNTYVYLGFVLGEENLPVTSYVLLNYDTKDPSKLLFVQMFLEHSKRADDGKEFDLGYVTDYYKKLV